MSAEQSPDRNFFEKALAVAEDAVASGAIVHQFQPNAGGEDSFFRSNANIRFLCGANSSGKTYSGLMEDAFHLIPEEDKYGSPTGYTIHPYKRLRIPPEGRHGWLSTYSQDNQKDNIQPLFDKILKPFITKTYYESGVLFWAKFKGGNLNMKWQTQGVDSYTGAKLDFIHFDEPHKEQIYNEGIARLLQKKGYAWSTLTPVVDVKKSVLRARDIMWIKRKIIDIWLRDRSKLPNVDVFFINIRENAAYVDAEFLTDMFAHMSIEERRVRETGMPVEFIGDSCFGEVMLERLDRYLLDHPEESVPEFGRIQHDDKETQELFKFKFLPTKESFPFEPESGWIYRIWEHPVAPILGIRPQYVIGCDVADGIPGGDYSCAYVKRADTGQIVASLHGYITQIELARQLWYLGWYYCNYEPVTGEPIPALLGVEVTGIGKATILFLLHGNKELDINAYDRRSLYRRPAMSDMKVGMHIPSDDFGWYTSEAHRHYLVSQMQMSLSQAIQSMDAGTGALLVDRAWVHGARTFLRDDKGKYRAFSGFYDDWLFGSAIADMVIKQSQFTMPQFVEPSRREADEPLMSIAPGTDISSGNFEIQLNFKSMKEMADHRRKFRTTRSIRDKVAGVK